MLKKLALAVSLSAFAVGAAHAADVVVSSKIDTEGTLLGNVIALALEANGIKTQDRIALGATPVVRKAITAYEIDIYPEYTGNAISSSTRPMTPPGRTSTRVMSWRRSSIMTPTRSSG